LVAAPVKVAAGAAGVLYVELELAIVVAVVEDVIVVTRLGL
jgi:hypothetical protein